MVKKTTQSRKPCYVLIIEDNVHHAEILTEVLDRHFAPVVIHTVDTIEDGIEFAGKSHYHLILTGAIIREVPASDAISKISKLAGGTPIVVISGKGDESLAAELIKRGATEYLVKTRETLENLPELLRKHIKKQRSRRKKTQPPAESSSSAHGHPSPAAIMREVDKLTQQALAIVNPKRRKTAGRKHRLDELDDLLNQIQRLREMTGKLSQKK